MGFTFSDILEKTVIDRCTMKENMVDISLKPVSKELASYCGAIAFEGMKANIEGENVTDKLINSEKTVNLTFSEFLKVINDGCGGKSNFNLTADVIKVKIGGKLYSLILNADMSAASLDVIKLDVNKIRIEVQQELLSYLLKEYLPKYVDMIKNVETSVNGNMVVAKLSVSVKLGFIKKNVELTVKMNANNNIFSGDIECPGILNSFLPTVASAVKNPNIKFKGSSFTVDYKSMLKSAVSSYVSFASSPELSIEGGKVIVSV